MWATSSFDFQFLLSRKFCPSPFLPLLPLLRFIPAWPWKPRRPTGDLLCHWLWLPRFSGRRFQELVAGLVVVVTQICELFCLFSLLPIMISAFFLFLKLPTSAGAFNEIVGILLLWWRWWLLSEAACFCWWCYCSLYMTIVVGVVNFLKIVALFACRQWLGTSTCGG